MPFLRDIVRIFFHSTLDPVVVHILESMRSQIPLSALLFPILLSLFLSLTSAVGASPSSGLIGGSEVFECQAAAVSRAPRIRELRFIFGEKQNINHVFQYKVTITNTNLWGVWVP